MGIGDLVQRTKLQVVKHSPEIMLAVGIGGTIVSVIMACKATLKAPDIIEEHKETMEKVHAEVVEESVPKETARVYIRTGVKLVKLYGPSVAIGSLSLGSIVMSNHVLQQRNTALAAAYLAIDKGFKEYRERVVERFGKGVDHQLRYNISEIEVEEHTTDSKGKEKVKKEKIQLADPNADGEFVKYFTRGNCNWANDSTLNEYFLRMIQSHLNDKLIAKKQLTLNEAYEALGFQPTKAGMVFGWLYDTKNPTGANMVELDITRVRIPDEDGSYDLGYAIDFNVDGNIYYLMK